MVVMPFLCLRRGVSKRDVQSSSRSSFSLPTQRCFPDSVRLLDDHGLFSAYAEVFLTRFRLVCRSKPFLCLRRGVSSGSVSTLLRAPLFSAYAEVFPPHRRRALARRPFLCLRRGVSCLRNDQQGYNHFSLPTQRCFSATKPPEKLRSLFSAYAEVFLS